jgi:hypothetical protein
MRDIFVLHALRHQMGYVGKQMNKNLILTSRLSDGVPHQIWDGWLQKEKTWQT